MAGVVVAAGLSAGAALTNPFTPAADTVVAVSIALGVALAAWRWRAPTTGRRPSAAPAGRWWPWALLVVLVVALELTTFLLGPRVDYPTLSSLYDSAARVRAVKGLFFLGWLGLGTALVRW